MTPRLAMTRAQARAIADVASEKNCIVEVERDGVTYRVIPEELARDDQNHPADDMPRQIDL